jgi:excisionase family DNA binding protein
MSQHANDRAADIPGTDTPPVRATIEEAARLLGVSENAIRKRIERGTLRSEKADGTRYVLLDNGMSQHVTDESDGMPHSTPRGMSEFVASLQDQIEFLRRELERKDAILMTMAQRIPELEAPSEDTRSASEATEAEDRGREVSEQQEGSQRRSWWREFFGLK